MKRLLAIALFAVTTVAQHREEVTVEVVEVPVYVHSTSGPIEGLTRDRFQLFVNGKPQPIEYFDAIDLAEPPAAAPKDTPASRDLRRRRLFLLLFDLVYSRPPALARARTAAAELVGRAPAGDAFAVATNTLERGVQFVAPFTSDRAVVTRAITQLRASNANDPMRLRITESEREVIANVGGNGRVPADVIEDPYTGGGDAMEDMRKQPLRRHVEDQVRELGNVAKRLGQLDGQKHVVVFSEGFNPYLVTDMGKGRRTGAPQANSHVIDLIHEMYGAFRAADTFLHAVDIAGLRHTFDPVMNDALNMLSSGTGGEFVHNANDIGGALDQLQRAHSYSYILGFTPRAARRGQNAIEVRIRDLPPGATVSHRRGFSGTLAPAAIDNLRLADILINDIPQLGVATELRRSDAGVILTVRSSAWAGLKPGEKPEALLYVFDGRGVVTQSKQLRLNPGAEHFNIPLEVQPGDVVKVLVRAGESLGFSRLAIE